jgi:hypothetical protein
MIKENINKIDYELKNLFESVSVEEKVDRDRFYFEIKVSGNKLNESLKNCEVLFQINKNDLNGTQVNWKYWSNPVTKDWQVERTSNIDYITKDISDIVLKGRLDSNYLSGLKK